MATNTIFSSSMSLTILDASYRYSHSVSVLLCLLILFHMMPSILVVSNGNISFFLKGWIVFYFMYLTHFLFSSLENTWVVCISWLLWIIQQWNWECSYLFKILILIILDTHPEWDCCIRTCVSSHICYDGYQKTKDHKCCWGRREIGTLEHCWW